MFKPNTARTLLAGVCLAALAAGRAHAQAVDYTSLQQMFGEPITTSVTGSPQRASEAPAAMTILTQDDIRRSGADNLPDILQFVTGIDIRRYSFGQADIAVRGYDQPLSPRMLVLVNGRQVYLDDYGYVDWNAIPVVLSEIRQIEVVKGPQSALFGFNAAAGVINIITYDPLLDTTNSATARTGTQHLGEGEAVGTGHIGKTFGVRVSLGGYTAHEFSGADTSSFPAPRNGRLNLDARWQITTRILLRAEAGMTDNRYAEYLPSGAYNAANTRTNDVRFGVDADTHLGVLGFDAYRNEAKELFSGKGQPSVVENVVKVARLSDLIKFGTSDTVRLGLEYRNNGSTSESLFHVPMSYDDYAASLMWNHLFSAKLSLVNAVRLDYAVLHSDADILAAASYTQEDINRTSITAPSFNSGVVYALSQIDTLRLTAARGLEMPSLTNFGLQSGNGGAGLVGSPYLSPTATWNVDLGYDRSLSAIYSSLTADIFLQRNTDLIAAPGAGTLIVSKGGAGLTDINVGSSNEAGLELGVKGKSPHGLHWNASYRLVALGEDITSAAGVSASTRPAGATPTSVVILGGGYATGKWEFDLNGRWQSDYRDYASSGAKQIEVGSYATLAGRIGYDLTRTITLGGSAQQLNLERIRQTGGLLVERRVIASITAHL